MFKIKFGGQGVGEGLTKTKDVWKSLTEIHYFVSKLKI